MKFLCWSRLYTDLIKYYTFILFIRSLQRALDRRLYLLLYGNTYGAPDQKPVWHFPEKVYESEETLRKVELASHISSVISCCFSFCPSPVSGKINILAVCSVLSLHWILLLETFPIHILLEMLHLLTWLYSQQKIPGMFHHSR